MSTFVLDKADIDAVVFLLTYGDRNRYGQMILSNKEYNDKWQETVSTQEDRTRLGKMMWGLNLEAAKQRYPGDESGQRPGTERLPRRAR